MSKLQELINELCPNGVEWKEVGDICNVSAGGDVPKGAMSKEKSSQYTIPIVSNGIGDNALYGYTSIVKITQSAVTVSARGTIGYAEYRDYPYFPVVRLLSLIPKDTKVLNTKYLYYCLQGKKYNVSISGIPQLTAPEIKKVLFPLPPLQVQKEIVRILDTFTELTTELTLRQKQYEYYRDKLLAFPKKGAKS